MAVVVLDFTPTGSDQSFVVPGGVSILSVSMRGAPSGFASAPNGTVRSISFNLPVISGETLTLKVGVKPDANASTEGGRLGGWPDGGDGGTNTAYVRRGLGGGGSSRILRGATLLAVAGGGGGMPSRTSGIIVGGVGGNIGTTGADGVSPNVVTANEQGGYGANTIAGGAGGPNLGSVGAAAGNAGGLLSGGSGASSANTAVLAGSGGGGGYYGGGGGSSRRQPIDGSGNTRGSAGGGGSSWITPELTMIVSGFDTSNQGIISFTYNTGGWSVGLVHRP